MNARSGVLKGILPFEKAPKLATCTQSSDSPLLLSYLLTAKVKVCFFSELVRHTNEYSGSQSRSKQLTVCCLCVAGDRQLAW